MKKTVKIWMAAVMSGMILANGAGMTGLAPWGLVAEAHSGRTDSQGGHKDNKNASGLGSYHYHCGGHPAHLHSDGVCPYASASGSASSQTQAAASKQTAAGKQTSAETVREQTAAGDSGGWHHDGEHWKYRCEDGVCLSGCWKQIDGPWYCFDGDGFMRTGWYGEEGCLYYLGTDGKMVTGTCTIDGQEYEFDQNGKMISAK